MKCKAFAFLTAVLMFSGCAINQNIDKSQVKTKSADPELINISESKVKCPELRIALFAPLTEEYTEYGDSIKKGAELAVSKFNSQNSSAINLVSYDTKGKQGEDLKLLLGIAEDQSTAGVIGPVLPPVNDIIKVANERRIPVITPSAMYVEKIPDNNFFFRNVPSPYDEGRQMAEYIVSEEKKTRLAVIHSNNLYSRFSADAFIETATKLGAEIIKVEKFEEGTYDFKEQMISLGGVDPHIIKDILESDKQNLESITSKLIAQIKLLFGPSKNSKVIVMLLNNIGKENAQIREELNFGEIISKKISYGLAKAKEIEVVEMAKVYKVILDQGLSREGLCKYFSADFIISGNVVEKYPLNYNIELTIENPSQNKSVSLSFNNVISDTPPVNPLKLDAVYIPVDYSITESIISHLLFFDLRLIYLGNSKWYNERFAKANKTNILNAVFTAPFYAGSTQPAVAEFVDDYKQKFFEEPDSLAGFGFDTANLLLNAIKDNSCNREDVKNKLYNLKERAGVTGIISFTKGEPKKDLHLLKLKNGELQEIR